MARPASTHPTDGELKILRILWDHGPIALSSLCRALQQERKVAITTVATMLKIMREKGLIRRQGAGRGATWSAVITHQRAAQGMVGKLIDGLFDGSADRLVTHLIEGEKLSAEELKKLRKWIRVRGEKS